MDSRFTLESGCFSRKPEVNRETAISWAVDENRIHGSYEKMLEVEAANLDAIVVLTPVADHCRMIEDCLERGLHVISEKPLTGSVTECERIAVALRRSGKFLGVTFNYTGYPMVRELRERVRRGDFGFVHSVRLTMQQEGFSRRDTDGNPVKPQAWRLEDGEIPTVSLDLGAHVVHLLEFVTGKVPVEVSGRMGSFGNFRQVIDDVDMLINCNDGTFAHAWWSKSALGHSNGLAVEVFGSEGSAKWVQMDPEFLYVRDTGGVESRLHRGSRGIAVANAPRYNRFKAGHPSGYIEAFANCYWDIADGLADHINTGGNSSDFVFGIDESMRVLQTLETGVRAAQSRQWETLFFN
jgi:predicted dehydrogenase